MAESTKISSIRKPYTHTSASDTTVAVRKFLAYESRPTLEYEIFTRTKISAIRVPARPPPPPPLGVSVAKHRAPVLQTCGLGRVSSDTSKNFRFEVQTCSWKTVIGASCPPAPHSYRCHVILTEPRGSANQIIKGLLIF